MTDNPLPFDLSKFDLIEDEVVDDSIDIADGWFSEFDEIVMNAEGIDRDVAVIHFFHRLTRLMIDHGHQTDMLITALKKVKRESAKAARVRAYADKVHGRS
jgi:hypothetical protein